MIVADELASISLLLLLFAISIENSEQCEWRINWQLIGGSEGGKRARRRSNWNGDDVRQMQASKRDGRNAPLGALPGGAR